MTENSSIDQFSVFRRRYENDRKPKTGRKNLPLMRDLKTQRGQEIKFLDGFLYTKDRALNYGIRWKCKMRPCKGSLLEINEDEYQTLNPHSCESNTNGKVAAFISAHDMRERVREQMNLLDKFLRKKLDIWK